MVVLYCISYNLGDDIPDTLSQFYENVFETVFFRHDNLKGKVNRERHWNDNRKIYRSLFEYFCFISQRKGFISFNRVELVNFIAESLKYMSENDSDADMVSDEIMNITNLIISDGFNEYRFIHKSIQEFFSASFLSNLDTDAKKRFYEASANNFLLHSSFSNTLTFLSEIDYYDFMRFYFLPDVDKNLDLNGEPITDNYNLSVELVELFLSSTILGVTIKKVKNIRLKKDVIEKDFHNLSLRVGFSDSTFHHLLFQFALSLIQIDKDEKLIIKVLENHGKRSGDEYYLNLKQMIKFIPEYKEKSETALLSGIGVLYRNRYNIALKKIKDRERESSAQGYLDFI